MIHISFFLFLIFSTIKSEVADEYQNSSDINDQIMKNMEELHNTTGPIHQNKYILALQITSDKNQIVTYGITRTLFTSEKVKYSKENDSPSFIDEYTSKMDFKVNFDSLKLIY